MINFKIRFALSDKMTDVDLSFLDELKRGYLDLLILEAIRDTNFTYENGHVINYNKSWYLSFKIKDDILVKQSWLRGFSPCDEELLCFVKLLKRHLKSYVGHSISRPYLFATL